MATQSYGVVSWKHNTPAGTSQYTTNSSNSSVGRTEFDPLGADISLTAPPDPPPSARDNRYPILKSHASRLAVTATLTSIAAPLGCEYSIRQQACSGGGELAGVTRSRGFKLYLTLLPAWAAHAEIYVSAMPGDGSRDHRLTRLGPPAKP